MLTRFRIEVEEETADEAVAALSKYERLLHLTEMGRYDAWTVKVAPEEVYEGLRWDNPHDGEADFYNELLGRELREEVIEYDETIPGYRGRRVVALTRVDTRSRGNPKSLTEITSNS